MKNPLMDVLPGGKSLRAFWTRFNRSVEFQLIDVQPTKIFVAKLIEWIEVPEGHEPLEASFTLNIESAQRLMDYLWWLGIRPAEHVEIRSNEPALVAQKEHIVDLRGIVASLSSKFLK